MPNFGASKLGARGGPGPRGPPWIRQCKQRSNRSNLLQLITISFWQHKLQLCQAFDAANKPKDVLIAFIPSWKRQLSLWWECLPPTQSELFHLLANSSIAFDYLCSCVSDSNSQLMQKGLRESSYKYLSKLSLAVSSSFLEIAFQEFFKLNNCLYVSNGNLWSTVFGASERLLSAEPLSFLPSDDCKQPILLHCSKKSKNILG